jgi:3-oxoacyl-[acyl-carrier protein] reductase
MSAIAKTYFIAGASSDLGIEIAEDLLGQGHRLVLSYNSNADKLQELQKKAPERIHLLHINSKADGTMAIRKKLSEIPHTIDNLIHCVGRTEVGAFPLINETNWKDLFEVNTHSAFSLIQAVLPQMVRARKGNILIIGSLAGEKLLAAPVHYCSTKASLSGFARGLSKEVGHFGVQVNCLAPGLLEGGIARHIPEDKKQDLFEHLSLSRYGKMSEIVKWAVFLTSSQNSYMTGQTFLVDGGF